MSLKEFKQKVKGPTVLPMTPFKKDTYELDLEALKENVRYIIDGGIRIGKGCLICPCGSGEVFNLSREEHKQIVEAAVEAAGGELPVIAGVTECLYKEAIIRSKNAEDAGAIGVMVAPPFYSKIDQESIFRWYKLISESISIGVQAYNQPWRTGQGTYISLETMERLVDVENVVSMKYPGGVQTMEYIEALNRFSDRFVFIDNSIGMTSTLAYLHGAAGYITGPADFWPELEAKYWSLLTSGKYKEAEAWHAKLLPLWHFRGYVLEEHIDSAMFRAAVEYVGIRQGPPRPPFAELSKENKDKLYKILEKIGVPKKE